MKKKFELGITTFGETTPMSQTGQTLSHSERISNLVEEIIFADSVGLDIYAIGEHHRADFAVSVPEMVLAGAAMHTKNIRLSSAVSVLSSSEPIRLYQNFATLDALSRGRAEIMVGKGSFIESFPLLGYDLNDYNALFEEKLAMLLEINQNEILHWQGSRLTHKVQGKGVYPRAVQAKLPIWMATGGSLQSVIYAAEKALPLAFAIIGGDYRAFRQLTHFYREKTKALAQGYLPIGSHSWGFIADTDKEATDEYFQPTKTMVDAIAKDRQHWQSLTYEQYLGSISNYGAMFVGSPQTVAQKIVAFVKYLDIDRFMLHIPIGSMPHQKVLRAIELFGKEVAPLVRKALNEEV